MHCSHVLVTGASGGVGSSAVLLAKAVGCRCRLAPTTRAHVPPSNEVTCLRSSFSSQMLGRVTAVTSSADKADFVTKLGADHVVVASDLANFHKQLPAGGKADIAIDCVGGPTMNASLRSVKPGGSIVVLGNVENRFDRYQCFSRHLDSFFCQRFPAASRLHHFELNSRLRF
jgi:NADPH:quinone reductase-like Zn-dependent oxidoreductase